MGHALRPARRDLDEALEPGGSVRPLAGPALEAIAERGPAAARESALWVLD